MAGRDARQSATLEATVTQYTLNETFHEYPFAKSYPPGTQVFDVTADVTSEARVRGMPEQTGGLQQQNDRATFDAIAAAWGRRQAKFRSFKFSWKRTSAKSGTSTHALCVDGVRFATTYLNADRKPLRFAAGAKGPAYPADTHLVFDGSTTTDLISATRKLATIHWGLRKYDVQHMGDRALLGCLAALGAAVGRHRSLQIPRRTRQRPNGRGPLRDHSN